MVEWTELVAKGENSSAVIIDELTVKMQQALTQTQTPTTSNPDNLGTQMGIKLDGKNYTLWSQVMETRIHS